MRVFIDDLEVRRELPETVRNHPQSRGKHDDFGGEAVVASVWLAFYLLTLGAAVKTPIFSHALELFAR
jgi:hypothetical protein